MTNQPSIEPTLAEELRQLGKNLTQVLHAAWERPERKAFQQEIANGLNELGIVLREETRKFSESGTGQRIQAGAEEIRQRIASRDEQARKELISALHAANLRLKQAAERWSPEGIPQTGSAEAPTEEPATGEAREQVWTAKPHTEGRHEVHPDDVDAPPKETGHQEIHPDDLE